MRHSSHLSCLELQKEVRASWNILLCLSTYWFDLGWWGALRATLVCSFFHRYFQNCATNWGQLSQWMTWGTPVLGNTFLKNRLAVSLAVMVLEQGTRMASLVRLHTKFMV